MRDGFQVMGRSRVDGRCTKKNGQKPVVLRWSLFSELTNQHDQNETLLMCLCLFCLQCFYSGILNN